MRIASNFGGGVAGWGSVCGAVSGAVMAIGLVYGTEGEEIPEEFEEKREFQRSFTKEFMQAFEDEWGTVKCLDLLGVDFRSPEGRERYELMKLREETHCKEYVIWSAEKILEMIIETGRLHTG
jgi:C_GCAxxG_C_C family probable redox protein